MGQWGPTTVSGEGSAQIDTGTVHQVTDILAQLGTVTSPRVRVLGTTSPKRVQFGGSYGLSLPDTSMDIVTYARHLAWEAEDIVTPVSDGDGYADRVWWRLPPGMELDLTAWWTI